MQLIQTLNELNSINQRVPTTSTSIVGWKSIQKRAASQKSPASTFCFVLVTWEDRRGWHSRSGYHRRSSRTMRPFLKDSFDMLTRSISLGRPLTSAHATSHTMLSWSELIVFFLSTFFLWENSYLLCVTRCLVVIRDGRKQTIEFLRCVTACLATKLLLSLTILPDFRSSTQ
jgi:hypothetical protein